MHVSRILIFVTTDDCQSTISLSSSPVPDKPEYTSWVDDLGLSVADEQVLVEGKWLTATHISAANSLLRSRFPSQNGLHDTCILKQKGVWISDSDGFVQIVHVSTGHWACLSNKILSSGTLELFDSLHTVPEEEDTIIPQACSILRTPEPSLTINVVNVGRQEGGSDCGLYAIAMAYDLCAGVDPVSKKYVQNEMRSHLHSCINAKQLKPFSSTDRDITISSVNVEVHCVECQKEANGWSAVIGAISGTTRGVFQSHLRCAMIRKIKYLGSALDVKQVHISSVHLACTVMHAVHAGTIFITLGQGCYICWTIVCVRQSLSLSV